METIFLKEKFSMQLDHVTISIHLQKKKMCNSYKIMREGFMT